MGLTRRQDLFVKFYDGNASKAAAEAGYADPGSRGCRLLKDPKVRNAIEAREQRADAYQIATREQRQEFWTSTMLDKGQTMGDRLKASELLGRSQTDFVTKVDMDVGLKPIKEATTGELEARFALLAGQIGITPAAAIAGPGGDKEVIDVTKAEED